MAQPLPNNPLPENTSRVKRYKRRIRKNEAQVTQKYDAASLASALQLQEEKRDFIYSFIVLAMKLGFFSIAISSLFNLGIASHHRIRRNIELSAVLNLEDKKFEKLHQRFDKLFTIGGTDRLMEEQDQWIAPNSIRVILR